MKSEGMDVFPCLFTREGSHRLEVGICEPAAVGKEVLAEPSRKVSWSDISWNSRAAHYINYKRLAVLVMS